MKLHIPARYLHFGLIAVLCLTVYTCQSKLPAAAVPCDYKLYTTDSLYESYCASCPITNTDQHIPNSSNISDLGKLPADSIRKQIIEDSLHLQYSAAFDSCALENLIRFIKPIKEVPSINDGLGQCAGPALFSPFQGLV